jgi:hypothetical protein
VRSCPLCARSSGKPPAITATHGQAASASYLRIGRWTRCLRRPSKQRVAGSNPARRAGQRHITILSLIVGSPTGSQRERMPLQRHFLRTGNRSRLTALPTARGLCDNRAPTAVLLACGVVGAIVRAAPDWGNLRDFRCMDPPVEVRLGRPIGRAQPQASRSLARLARCASESIG